MPNLGTVKQSHYRPGEAKKVIRKLRSLDFMTTAQNGGNVVSLTHRPPLPPGNSPGTHFCCLISVPTKMVERQRLLYCVAVRYLTEGQCATVGVVQCATVGVGQCATVGVGRCAAVGVLRC